MKFYLVIYLCSIISGQCPSNSITALSYGSHYDCVVDGYRVAHNTFKNLEENTKIIFYSTSTLEESMGDDIRFEYDKWDIWKEDYR